MIEKATVVGYFDDFAPNGGVVHGRGRIKPHVSGHITGVDENGNTLNLLNVWTKFEVRDGVLYDPETDQPGIDVIAPNESTNPPNFNYAIVFDLWVNNKKINFPFLVFEVEPGQVVDIGEVRPAVGEAGQLISKGERGEQGPLGPIGPRGPEGPQGDIGPIDPRNEELLQEAKTAQERVTLEHDHVHQNVLHADIVASAISSMLDQAITLAETGLPPRLLQEALDSRYLPMRESDEYPGLYDIGQSLIEDPDMPGLFFIP
jgi:hypothetical protein